MTLKRIVHQSLVQPYMEESMSQDQEVSKRKFYQSGTNLHLATIIGLVLLTTIMMEHGGMTQIMARLPFLNGTMVSQMVELVKTAHFRAPQRMITKAKLESAYSFMLNYSKITV